MAYPAPAYPDRYQYQTQVSFGGYDHRRAPGAYSKRLNNNAYRMDWWDAENLTTDYLPVFGVRNRHCLTWSLDNIKGFIGGDTPYCVADYTDTTVTPSTTKKRLYSGSNVKTRWSCVSNVPEFDAALDNEERLMVKMGPRLIIFPDKICYNEADYSLQNLEASAPDTDDSAFGFKFYSGSYMGEPATANCIQIIGTVDYKDYFKVGQAVTIAGDTAHNRANDITVVIREMESFTVTPLPGQTRYVTNLHFYDNTFVFDEEDNTTVYNPDGTTTEIAGYSATPAIGGKVTLSRNVPDLDILFAHENRLWGAKGDTIYASALGDPLTWYNYDTVDTAAWSVDVLDEGDFTAGCSFLGYPIFFKDNHIYKVYGSVPSEYSLVQSADLGVEAGSGRSLAIAGEKLYYLSRAGVCVYSGALPQVISQPLGDIKYCDGVAGTDGLKYYITMQSDPDSASHETFVYDTQTGLWQKEGDIIAKYWGWLEGCGMLAVTDAPTTPIGSYTNNCYIWFIGHLEYAPKAEDTAPARVHPITVWTAETFDITETSPLRKWVGAPLEIRVEMERESVGHEALDNSGFGVFFQFGDEDTFHLLGKFYTTAEDGHVPPAYADLPIEVVEPGKRSYILPQIPVRTDYFRIRIVGYGKVWIYSIAPQTEQGSSWHGINGQGV